MTQVMLRVRLRRQAPFPIAVDFTTPARGVTALFGPSGCGKTTVVDLIAGARKADSGLIAVAEQVLYASEELATFSRSPDSSPTYRYATIFSTAGTETDGRRAPLRLITS